MRLAFLILIVILSHTCLAQDMPDYRSKKELFSRIAEKDIRADISSFAFGGLDESVGKLPLKTLPVTGTGSNFISFAGDNKLQVKITSVPFDPTKHKLGYYEKFLAKIDNRAYFGDYGKIPKTAIENVLVTMGRDTIAIPPAAFADLYNPIFAYSQGGVEKTLNSVYLSADGRKIYIYMLKQEAGGSYEVTWVIQDKKYLRRVVDFGFLK